VVDAGAGEALDPARDIDTQPLGRPRRQRRDHDLVERRRIPDVVDDLDGVAAQDLAGGMQVGGAHALQRAPELALAVLAPGVFDTDGNEQPDPHAPVLRAVAKRLQEVVGVGRGVGDGEDADPAHRMLLAGGRGLA
jgi:hypothetical protein